MRKTKLFVLFAALGLLLSACNEVPLPVSTQYTDEELENIGQTIDTPWVDYSTPATNVSFPDEDKSITIEKGGTYTYSPKIEPKSATIAALDFTSQDLNIATVTELGVLTAVGPGSTTVVVSSKENSFNPITLSVTVTSKILDFTLNKTELDLGYGQTEQLSVTYDPVDTTEKGVTFTSSNAEVATVSEDGLVTGVKDGNTTIKVQSPYINTIKEVNVAVSDKVIHVKSVNIANVQNTLEIDKSFNIEASITPSNADNKGINYSSSNEEVATIDNTGLVSALKAGTTTITAEAAESSTIKETFVLDVYEVTADEIVVDSALNLILNQTHQLHPTYRKAGEVVTPSRANLTYESKDTKVVTVNSAGLVTAKGLGSTTIVLKDGQLEKVINATVNLDIVAFTVSNFESFTLDDGALVFAWVWGGDAGVGSWVQVQTSVDGTTNAINGTFNAPRNITGLVLVRCVAGTVTPNWELTTGETAGRIFNKTEDISNPTTELVAPKWVEYPEKESLSGYGIMFNGGAYFIGEDAGVDYQQRAQYSLEKVLFPKDAKFSLYNFSEQAGWAEQNIDPYSFGGSEENKDAWKAYLSIDEGNTEYTVLQTFTADLFIKIAYENNSIYFGLKEEIPVGNVYSVKIGDTLTNLVEGTPTGTETKMFHASNLNVEAGQAITFYMDNVAIKANLGPDADDLTPSAEKYNNYMGTLVKGFTIQKTTAEAELYFRVYQNGMSFWISGGDSATHVVVFAPYAIHGTTGNFVEVTLADNPDNEEEYFLQLTLAADEEVKFHLLEEDENGWFGYSNLKEGITVAVTGTDDGNIKFTNAGKYDFYITKSSGAIWVEAHVDPIPLANVYSMKINNVDVGLTKSTEGLATDEAMKFTKNGVAVEAGQDITMFADDVAITKDLGPDADDTESELKQYNNYIGSLEKGFKVQKTGSVDITMHVWKSGWVTFWISGGENDDHALPVDYFLIGSFNTWTTSDATYKLTKVNATQYQIQNVTFVAGAKLKVFWPEGETEEDKYISNSEAWNECGFTVDGDGNIVVTNEGIYTVDFYPADTQGHHVVLTKTADVPVTYTVTIGETPYTLVLDENAEHTGDYANRTALYKVQIPSVTTGQVVEFKKNGVALSYFNLADGNNNIIKDNEVYKIKDTKESAVTLYLNVWKPNAQSEIWCTAFLEGAAVVATQYYLIGLNNDWNNLHDEYKLTVDALNENHYSITGVEIAADAKFKVVDSTKAHWYGNEATWTDCGFTHDDDKNIVISAAGVYTVDFYLGEAIVDGKQVVPTKTGEIVSLQIDENSANLTVGGSDKIITASNVTGTLTANSGNEDVATTVATGNTVTIHPVGEGNTTITIGDDKAVTRTVTVTVSKPAAKVTITLTSTADVGFGYTLYLVGDFCNWKINANAIMFAYNTDHWEVSFEVDANTTYSCKLVKALSENPAEDPAGWEGGNNRSLTFTTTETIILTWQ